MLEIISICASVAALMISCFSLGVSYSTWQNVEKTHQNMLKILEGVHNLDVKVVPEINIVERSDEQ